MSFPFGVQMQHFGFVYYLIILYFVMKSETDFPMLGGLSFVMAMLRGCLGEYLALTGLNVHGADLVHSGLIQRFISPDAIEVLQLTADVCFNDFFVLKKYRDWLICRNGRLSNF